MSNNEKLLFKAMEYCQQTKVSSLEYEAEGLRIIIRKDIQTEAGTAETEEKILPVPAAQKVGMEAVEEKELPESSGDEMTTRELLSEMAGIFYDRSAPEQEPFLTVGKEIRVGDVIGLVEVMKCFMEVKAAASGIVREILVSNGTMIEYGQALAVLEEAAE